jgi:hypothetical protein
MGIEPLVPGSRVEDFLPVEVMELLTQKSSHYNCKRKSSPTIGEL